MFLSAYLLPYCLALLVLRALHLLQEGEELRGAGTTAAGARVAGRHLTNNTTIKNSNSNEHTSTTNNNNNNSNSNHSNSNSSHLRGNILHDRNRHLRKLRGFPVASSNGCSVAFSNGVECLWFLVCNRLHVYNVCVHIYIYIYTYTHTYIHTHIHMCMYVFAHLSIYLYVYICIERNIICIYIYIYMYIHNT